MLIRFLFLILLPFSVLAEEESAKRELAQELIQVAEVVGQIEAHFGPFESFAEDKGKIYQDFLESGMSETEAYEHLAVMEAYYKKTQQLKAPIVSSITSRIEAKYMEHFTKEELQNIIRCFSDPAMQKFLKTSKELMIDIGEIVDKEMAKVLGPAHKQMIDQLQNIQYKHEHGVKHYDNPLN